MSRPDTGPSAGSGARSSTGPANLFEEARPKLMAIAYRMLGSVAEAEDVVGDVAERWLGADIDEIRAPEAWLVTATTRRALDVLRSARVQREQYPGVWLPEPIATDGSTGSGDIAEQVERVEMLTIGFLLLLERLTPLERVVFVLRDALDYSYAEIADATGRSREACRQALHRARKHVAVPQRRTEAEREEAAAAAERFVLASLTGDIDALMATLAPDVVLTSDGGGVVYAAIHTVTGPRRVARFAANLTGRELGDDPFVAACELNGSPGLVVHGRGSWLAIAIESSGGLVTAIRAVVNPSKLERLVASLPGTDHLPHPSTTPARYRHRGGKPVTRDG